MKILQLSDTHLFFDDNQLIFGINPNKKLELLINYLLESRITFEKIFLTGDVSQDMSHESYQNLVDQLIKLKKPVYWIPGNHDDLNIMHEIFNKSEYFQFTPYLKTKYYSFIFLNTKYKDLDAGHFNEEDERLIENILKNANRNEKFCIVMHHHPLKTGTPLVDAYILENTEKFWSVIDRYPTIDHIICGHVHGDYTLQHKNVVVHTSMATCLQWKKKAEKKVMEDIAGCKLYEFFKNSVVEEAIFI